MVDKRCGSLVGDWCTNIVMGPYGVRLGYILGGVGMPFLWLCLS
jgi:hypothetical protein